MNKKITWINTAIFALILLVAVLFIPQNAPAYPNSEGKNNSSSSSKNSDMNMRLLQHVYEMVKKNYVDEVDPKILYQGAMEGMLNALNDPYTTYVYRDTVLGQDLQDTTEGKFCGIGVHITKAPVSTPERPAYVEIASPIEDTPGFKAGLQSGDYITEIEGEPTEEMTMEDVLNKLRGREGTDVTIKILRGKNMEFDLTITRAIIEIPTVKYAKIDDDIAYIRLIMFNPNSAQRVTEALHELESQGCKKLIFDLRNNPGGLITSSVDVTSIFVKSGMVVSTKGRALGTNNEYRVKRFVDKASSEMPIVVLINQGSASASEIVSGALKDHKRAYLVGTRSYGKGLVQNIIPLNSKEEVKITIARYYSPSGANIDKLGIKPDLDVVPMKFTPEEEEHANELLKTSEIPDFTRSKKELSRAEMLVFAKKLAQKYEIREKLILRLIKIEYNRSHASPIVDLYDDVQLKTAIDLLNNKNVNELSSKTKTLMELQEAEKAEKEKESKK